MKIRTSLTVRYTCVTASLFLIFVIAVCCISEHSRSSAFFRDLRSEAVTKANLFLSNRVDATTMQSIYLNNKQFIDEVEVAVYTPDFKMLYHDALQNDIIKESAGMIKEIRKKKALNFYVGDYQAVGIVYPFKGKDYIVTAAAYDGYGYANRNALWGWLVVLIIVGLTILVVVGYFFARTALAPLRSIIQQAEKISASRINERLPVKNERDELGELSLTFNSLLDRLEKSFNAQKMFVSNVSHELRTPLAALTTQLDLALLKERTVAEYEAAIGAARGDAARLATLITGLLDLAKSDYESDQIKMKRVRLDELLIDSIDLVMRAHPDYHIELIFEQEADDDNVITVMANPYLLTTAFVNLIDNNCKYSANHTSMVQISFWEESAIVRFSDNGIGMSDKDKENLFELFYRGDSKGKVAGYGIGMALTHKVIALHNGDVSVSSNESEGTTFVVKLPHV